MPLAALKERVEAEVRIMKGLVHPNVVRLFDTYTVGPRTHIFIELMQGGTMFDAMGKKGIPDKRARGYFRQILEGIKYIHSMKV